MHLSAQWLKQMILFFFLSYIHLSLKSTYPFWSPRHCFSQAHYAVDARMFLNAAQPRNDLLAAFLGRLSVLR